MHDAQVKVPSGHPLGAVDDLVAVELWRPAFPAADLVDSAAAMLPGQPCGAVQEGPSWRITVSPGRVRIWTKDEARAERRENDERALRMKAADAMATFIEVNDDGELISDVPDAALSREITGWSRKSRCNMFAVLSDLDYAPLFGDPTRLPAMGTLTYPGCWLRVAPNGRAVKRHMKTLRKRYRRAFGEDLPCTWKQETQDRPPGKWCRCEVCDGRDDGRAPHVHMLICPPHVYASGDPVNFREWLRLTWADIVAHPDPEQRRRHELAGCNVDFAEGLRASDPRRVAAYFSKHGAFAAKEYQNRVPRAWQEPGQGPGRFWGYWGLKPATATRAVSPQVGTAAGRIVRRYSHAQRVTHQVRRPRAAGGVLVSKYPDVVGLTGAQLLQSHRVRYRASRVRAVRARNGRGWLSLNSGPAFAVGLAYALHQDRDQRDRDLNRVELERCGLWNTPLARARRLPPSPRRDALLSRLGGSHATDRVRRYTPGRELISPVTRLVDISRNYCSDTLRA